MHKEAVLKLKICVCKSGRCFGKNWSGPGWQEDFVGFSGPVENWFSLTPEDVLVVFPEDIHMVRVADPEPIPVSKCCFKFRA